MDKIQFALVAPFVVATPLLFPISLKQDMTDKTNVDTVPPIVKFYAKFAQQSYLFGRRTDLNFGRGTWRYRDELSSVYQAIWTKGREAVYSIRGTGMLNPLDLSVRGVMFVKQSKLKDRVGWATRRLHKLLKKYDRVIFVGHSMGGTLVMETIRTLDPKLAKRIVSVALDPPITKFFLKKQHWKDKKLYIYRTAGDTICVNARLIKATRNVTYKPKYSLLPPHMIEQLL